MKLAGIAVLFGAVWLGLAHAEPAEPTRHQVAGAYQRALAHPMGLDDYLAVLPRDGERYVTEGDLIRTRDEIAGDFERQRQAESPRQPGELTVNVRADGGVDIWARPQRALTYSIDRGSFATPALADSVLKLTAKAAAEWVAACGAPCGVTFTFKEDPTPTTAEATFVIRGVDARGEYVAAAFFPSYAPVRRMLNVDRTFHQLGDVELQQGVLRHELGHVLGYRHEQVRGVPGCFAEGGRWQPVTPYNPTSTMHYHCGGGGTPRLTLSELDKQGHRDLYSR